MIWLSSLPVVTENLALSNFFLTNGQFIDLKAVLFSNEFNVQVYTQ